MSTKAAKDTSASASSTQDATILLQSPSDLDKFLASLSESNISPNISPNVSQTLKILLSKPSALLALVGRVQDSNSPQARQMAALYLRDQVEHKYLQLVPETQSKLKDVLIYRFGLDCSFRPERMSLASLITCVARQELLNNDLNWVSSHLIPLLTSHCVPNVAASPRSRGYMIEASVAILRNLIQFCGLSLRPQFVSLLRLFAGLIDPPNARDAPQTPETPTTSDNANQADEAEQQQQAQISEISKISEISQVSLLGQIETCRAIGVMAEFLDSADEADRKVLNEIEAAVAGMFDVFECCVTGGNVEQIVSVLGVFNDLAETKVWLLKERLLALVRIVTGLVRNGTDRKLRKEATQFVKNLINCDSKTVMKEGLEKDFLALGIDLVAMHADARDTRNPSGEDAKESKESVGVVDDVKIEENVENTVITSQGLGCDILDDLFKSLPSEATYPQAMERIQALLDSKGSQSHQTALVVIAMMIEGASRMIAFGSDFERILSLVLSGCQSADLAVRKCALEALAQLAIHMGSRVALHQERILPTLLAVFDAHGTRSQAVAEASNDPNDPKLVKNAENVTNEAIVDESKNCPEFGQPGQVALVYERALNALELTLDAVTEQCAPCEDDEDDEDSEDSEESEENDEADQRQAISHKCHEPAKEIVRPILPRAMQVILFCLQSGRKASLRMQAFNTLASLAGTAQTDFAEYLVPTLELLQSAMTDAPDVAGAPDALEEDGIEADEAKRDELIQIRAEATSCLALVANAVGWERYEEHFERFHRVVMEGLYNIDDSRIHEYSFMYFAEMSRVMRENLLRTDGFEDILQALLWVLQDDDGMEVKLPEDGFDADIARALAGIDVDPIELKCNANASDAVGQVQEKRLDELAGLADAELEDLIKKAPNGRKSVANVLNGEDEKQEENEKKLRKRREIMNSVGQLRNVRVSVRKGFMEAKAAGVHCLTMFMKYAGEGMFAHWDEMFDSLQHAWEYPHTLVKMATCNALKTMFECLVARNQVKLTNEEHDAQTSQNDENKNNALKDESEPPQDASPSIEEFVNLVFPQYIDALVDEEDGTALHLIVDNLLSQLRLLHETQINENNLASFATLHQSLSDAIVKYFNGTVQLFKSGDDPLDAQDEDEESADITARHEDVTDAVVEIVAALPEWHGLDDFAQVWSRLFPALIGFISGHHSNARDQAAVIGAVAEVLDVLVRRNQADLTRLKRNDVIRNSCVQTFKCAISCVSGKSGVSHASAAAQGQDENEQMTQQNGLYCLGALFQVCDSGHEVQNYALEALEWIKHFVSGKNAQSREDMLVRDNAVAALAKMIPWAAGAVNEANEEKQSVLGEEEIVGMVGEFVDAMPLVCDLSENDNVFRVLMWLGQSDNKLRGDNAERIVALLADALGDEEVDEDITNQIVAWFRRGKADQEIVASVSKLDADEQEYVKNCWHGM